VVAGSLPAALTLQVEEAYYRTGEVLWQKQSTSVAAAVAVAVVGIDSTTGMVDAESDLHLKGCMTVVVAAAASAPAVQPTPVVRCYSVAVPVRGNSARPLMKGALEGRERESDEQKKKKNFVVPFFTRSYFACHAKSLFYMVLSND